LKHRTADCSFKVEARIAEFLAMTTLSHAWSATAVIAGRSEEDGLEREEHWRSAKGDPIAGSYDQAPTS
jgi:hypothetical protein